MPGLSQVGEATVGMLVIRHKVKDYSKWRPEFDRHASAQRSAGLTNPRVFRSSDDPNEVVIFFNASDMAKAKDFAASPNLKSTMAKAGVQGGVANDVAITPGFGAQVHASGLRPGHYRAFINLLRHAYLWDKARERYGEITVVLVVYGDRDWSREDERQRTVKAIPGAKMETVAKAGHFLSLDQPERCAEMIKSFTAANASRATRRPDALRTGKSQPT
jgi:pimeloyl-ACP methyl ester carboxylesterase